MTAVLSNWLNFIRPISPAKKAFKSQPPPLDGLFLKQVSLEPSQLRIVVRFAELPASSPDSWRAMRVQEVDLVLEFEAPHFRVFDHRNIVDLSTTEVSLNLERGCAELMSSAGTVLLSLYCLSIYAYFVPDMQTQFPEDSR